MHASFHSCFESSVAVVSGNWCAHYVSLFIVNMYQNCPELQQEIAVHCERSV